MLSESASVQRQIKATDYSAGVQRQTQAMALGRD